jgi:hypothetical protein
VAGGAGDPAQLVHDDLGWGAGPGRQAEPPNLKDIQDCLSMHRPVAQTARAPSPRKFQRLDSLLLGSDDAQDAGPLRTSATT